MKKIFFLVALIALVNMLNAQTYPDPEYANEIYFLKKDNPYSLIRLEKGASKMETKTSMIKGSEQGYSLDGTKSNVRIQDGSNLSFVFTTGSSSSTSSNSGSDSIMKANGVDPKMLNFGGMMDPTNNITLYKMDIAKDERKIYLMKQGGYFGNHKNQSSDKYTFSLKKIRDGYWELVIDKTLPKGEYAFTMMAMGMQAMDGGMTLFAFGVD